MALAASVCGLLLASCSGTPSRQDTAGTHSPHLEKRGPVTQLIVEGKPWLVLGCELGNSTDEGFSGQGLNFGRPEPSFLKVELFKY